ncbi:hypothetical protein [uncultured Psychroserpens sp.]|uniref:hypothetical protein n=1 Tax=uncultured Psychroserpens sp. TaxID=255436 RepID=UPI00262CA55D|nr:hypothetical protein [uncultured Psychroserpens sp.]
MKTLSIKSGFILFSISFLIFSCAPRLSSSFVKEGYTDKTYSKIAVIGISNDLTSRLAFERTAVNLFKNNGINVVQGIDIFPQNMSEKDQQPANLIKIIKDNNLDGVITMSLISTNDGHRYQQGNSYSVPAGYYKVGKHIYQRYITVSEPGYYVPTKSYVIEAVLYNLKGELVEGKETWVWTGESSLVDPYSLQSAALTFSQQMVGQIIKDEIIIPK